MELRDQLLTIATQQLKDERYFIVDVIVKGSGGGKMKVLVLLDGDEGVNIDDCADLSRTLGTYIETEEIIERAYVLEVSSPGLEHPLKLSRQYAKNTGRRLKIQLKDGQVWTGKLTKSGENRVEFEKEVKEKKKTVHQPVTIALDEIEKASVLVSFK